MAYGLLPKPGKIIRGQEIGSCVNENCGHSDCEETRKMAKTKCFSCNKEIGYETPFYQKQGRLIHAKCL